MPAWSGNMTEYAIVLSLSFRNCLHYLSLNYQVLLPGIILAAAFVLLAVGLFKPPKV
jgi:hypothetical protein